MPAVAERSQKVAWKPQPGSQFRFLSSPFFETLYSGTRGVGKTEALLCDFAQHVGQGHGRAWRGILFREESTQLEDVVNKTLELFPRIWSEDEARYVGGNQSKWKWASGEELLFRHMRRRQDYQKYHGHEYPWIGWEELTNWSDPVCYHLMKSCCRTSTEGVPLKYRATCNPYGPGHNWVKSYFVDPAEEGEPFTPDVERVFEQAGIQVPEELDLTGRRAVRVSGHYEENRALMETQPDYAGFIAAAAENPAQAKAWLKADWDIVAGGMFDDVWDREVHVLEGWPPQETPPSWRVDRAFDWGSSKPFSVGWWAEADGTEAPDGANYPRGTLIRIAEWYGWSGSPNEGLRLTDREIARGIRDREQEMEIHDRVRAGPGDLQTAEPGKQSMEAVFRGLGVPFREPDKRSGSRQAGWSTLRRMLKTALEPRPEEPCLYVFESCRQFIRTVPTLPRADSDPDDVDTEAEDHIADETRYRVTAPKRTARGVDFRV